MWYFSNCIGGPGSEAVLSPHPEPEQQARRASYGADEATENAWGEIQTSDLQKSEPKLTPFRGIWTGLDWDCSQLVMECLLSAKKHVSRVCSASTRRSVMADGAISAISCVTMSCSSNPWVSKSGMTFLPPRTSWGTRTRT